MPTCLVTGGAGFLGSHLCDELLRRGQRVICVDNLETGSLAVPEPLRAVGAALGTDPLSFLLGGGDDHSLLATFPDTDPLPDGWQPIGRVHEGEGVTVDGAAYDGPSGWTHF